MISQIVFEDDSTKRLDTFLAQENDIYSRSLWNFFVDEGFIKVNDKIQKPKYNLSKFDKIFIDYDKINSYLEKKAFFLKPLDLELDIIYENKNLIIINKPHNLSTHPGSGNNENTLVNALVNKYNLSDCGGQERLGIVHRLDKDTSGLIVVAKNNFSHKSLAKQIETRLCKRKYLAFCHGVIVPSFGNISTYIGPQQNDHRRMEVVTENDQRGKFAITNYKTVSVFCNGSLSLVEFSLETGRTHQIRVHSLHLKHPLIGDNVYNNSRYRYFEKKIDDKIKKLILEFKRQALHSYYIKLQEPETGEDIEITIDLPNDMLNLQKNFQ